MSVDQTFMYADAQPGDVLTYDAWKNAMMIVSVRHITPNQGCTPVSEFTMMVLWGPRKHYQHQGQIYTTRHLTYESLHIVQGWGVIRSGRIIVEPILWFEQQ